MRKHVSDREYSKKVTDAALFAIDMIKRKRMKGFIHDNDIALKLGCSAGTIHYWRKGERSITLDQIGALIKEFDVDSKFLMKQEGSVWGEAELMLRIKALEDRMEIAEVKLRLPLPKTGK